MNVARILYPVQVLGPGNRLGIWVCGCAHACKGCSNPELWEQRPEFEVTTCNVVELVKRVASFHRVDGFTISGGEPMDQTAPLADLLDMIVDISDDILIYTGYQIEKLIDRHDPSTDSVLKLAAVLVDGEYIEEQNDNAVLRGSSNQRVHILNTKYTDKYQRYLAETHNKIQNFTTSDGVVSVGIHHPTF